MVLSSFIFILLQVLIENIKINCVYGRTQGVPHQDFDTHDTVVVWVGTYSYKYPPTSHCSIMSLQIMYVL